MLIALEGVDGSGKSTLANDVVSRLKEWYPNDEVHLLHAGPLKTDAYTAYLEPLKDYKPGSGVHYVLDRWHVGERIYGPLYREKSAIDDATWIWLEMKFASLGMALFHVYQPIDEIRRRLDARGEDFLKAEHVEQVQEEFFTHINKNNSLTYSTRVMPNGRNDLVVDTIMGHALITDAIAVGLPKSYVGNPHATHLLVGDRMGGSGPYPCDGAFRPVNGNSSTFLLNSLNAAYVWSLFETSGWLDFALINSDPNEEPELAKAVGDAMYVGTLGAEAKKRVDALFPDLTFTSFPHPQYVQRFYNGRRSEYGILITSSIEHGEDYIQWPNS